MAVPSLRVFTMCGGFVATMSHAQPAITLEYIAPGNMWHADISESGSIAFVRSEGSYKRLFRFTDGHGLEMLDIGDRDYLARPKINTAGQIAFHGLGANGVAALRYTDGVGVESLSSPEVSYALAHAINDHGQVAGTSDTEFGDHMAFRYSDGLGLEAIELGDPAYDQGSAVAINNLGMLAGIAHRRGTGNYAAYRYSDEGGVEFLDDFGGTMWVSGINNRGDIAGMGSLPDNGGLRFFLYTDEAGLMDIGSVGHQGELFDINDDRWIIGWDPYTVEPILWTPTTGWSQLESLLPPWMDADLVTALGINNAGQIVGNGIINGEAGIYRLTIHSIPTPPPLAALALAAGIAAPRRRR